MFFVIYSGDYIEKATILRSFEEEEKALKWLESVAVSINLHSSHLDTREHLKECMYDYYDICIVPWEEIKNNPTSFGEWGEASLWALFNHKFSQFDEEFWTVMKNCIKFPDIGEREDSDEN